MEKNTKVVLGISTAAILGWLLFFRKKAGAEVTPQGGIGFATAPPASETEGQTYTATVTVHNTSTKAGNAAGYIFKTALVVALTPASGGTTIYSATKTNLDLAAGASFTGTEGIGSACSWSFTIPVGMTGQAIAIAYLYTSDGVTILASTPQFAINIVAAAIVPGGTINW